MTLKFSKMHGLGNDFMVVDGVRQSVQLSTEQICQWGDRHRGVGFDQLLLVEPAQQAGADFRYRIFNADGSEVEQCGNGARCFVRFVHEQGLTDKTAIVVETQRGLIQPRLEADGMVTVDMGTPKFAPVQIPFVADQDVIEHDLTLPDGTKLAVGVVSMGNPHAVVLVAHVETAPVAVQGPQIEQHERFPQRVNAGFMQVLNPQQVRLRVYERGAGETLACGTGACAAVVSGVRRGLLTSPVQVQTRGGELTIAWAGGDAPVIMTGPAVTVFTGEIAL